MTRDLKNRIASRKVEVKKKQDAKKMEAELQKLDEQFGEED